MFGQANGSGIVRPKNEAHIHYSCGHQRCHNCWTNCRHRRFIAKAFRRSAENLSSMIYWFQYYIISISIWLNRRIQSSNISDQTNFLNYVICSYKSDVKFSQTFCKMWLVSETLSFSRFPIYGIILNKKFVLIIYYTIGMNYVKWIFNKRKLSNNKNLTANWGFY